MDFIFITGPSAVGKTTLAKRIYESLGSTPDGAVYIEQNMVPEFTVPSDVDEGVYEETMCFENVLAQIDFFHRNGRKNIIALDFDDFRVRELPKIFRGCEYIIYRLYSGDTEQIRRQMEHRCENEGGLYFPDGIEKSNSKIMSRPLLPNEVKIDVCGKTADEVFDCAMDILTDFSPVTDYGFELPPEELYLSWVKSRGLQ